MILRGCSSATRRKQCHGRVYYKDTRHQIVPVQVQGQTETDILSNMKLAAVCCSARKNSLRLKKQQKLNKITDMPSEKMRYTRRCMEDKPLTYIEQTPLKKEIELVFSKLNIDEDCDTIADLLLPYQENMCRYLISGNYADAVTILLKVLESLTYHFVEDEHYVYFDDLYAPDYVCEDMIKKIIDTIKSGKLPEVELRRLKEGLEKLKHSEAYKDYGTPYALYVWEKFEKS